MFGYAPTVNDNSGEIKAAGTIKGAEGISSGISQAASGISGALDKLTAYKMQADQADSTAALAGKMKIIDPEAVQMIQALPWNQKVSIAPNLIQMVGQKTAADHYAAMMSIAQQNANIKAGSAALKNTGINPWNSTPAPGGLGSSGAGVDDSAQ
jgi:hypothetical protein